MVFVEAFDDVTFMYWYLSLTIFILFQLDIMEPKVPEDIYKTHLEHASESGPSNSPFPPFPLFPILPR